jgi:hypothetical protein
VIEVGDLAVTAQASLITTRKHLVHVAARLRLRLVTRRRVTSMPRGGVRHYERQVLLRRGRYVPPSGARHRPEPAYEEAPEQGEVRAADPAMRDQARKKRFIARLIHRRAALGRRCRARLTLALAHPRPPPQRRG